MQVPRDLELLIEANSPLIAIDTHEEARAVQLLVALAHKRGSACYRWKVSEGLVRLSPATVAEEPGAYAKPVDLLRHLATTSEPGLYLLLDLQPFLADPVHARLLKDAVAQGRGRTLVLIGHELKLPGDLERMAAPFELPSLSRDEVLIILKEEVAQLRAANPAQELMGEAEAVEGLLQHLSGLGAADARRVIRQILLDGALTEADFKRIYQAKRDLLGRDGVLSLEEPAIRLDDLAGLDNMKQWLLARREAFRGNPEQTGLDVPKGVLLLGVQGCGKSMAAKAVAVAWGVPLLRIDFGALYNKYLGETERNLREALKVADAMSPCVLWLDEIEKGLASSDSDGGESRRLLGTLLTWMAERRRRVFLVATSNDIERLPPELVRKGRMDEIFFVDLPGESQRAEILRIHLQRRGQDAAGVDLAALAKAAEGFSGAEIEQAVVSSLYAAKLENQPLAGRHVAAELARTKPLSVVMAEKVAYLRLWAQGRTVPAD